MSHKVGAFEVRVDGPYPCFVQITCGANSMRFHHKELVDIAYAIAWAQREARIKLSDDSGKEMEADL